MWSLAHFCIEEAEKKRLNKLHRKTTKLRILDLSALLLEPQGEDIRPSVWFLWRNSLCSCPLIACVCHFSLFCITWKRRLDPTLNSHLDRVTYPTVLSISQQWIEWHTHTSCYIVIDRKLYIEENTNSVWSKNVFSMFSQRLDLFKASLYVVRDGGNLRMDLWLLLDGLLYRGAV